MSYRSILPLVLSMALSAWTAAGQSDSRFPRARENGKRFEEAVAASQRVLHAWLSHADPKTLLLPDRIPGRAQGLAPGDTRRLYTPHNSGADLYPYLILTANLTDPDLYHGRLMEMLRNEVRFTTRGDGIPANLEMSTRELGPPSLFGAGEYAKDGLLSVTEYLGRTPWFYRMVDMTADAMNQAPVNSRFGRLPASDAELNGDYLQTLVRLSAMTGDKRFIEWARRIGDAYIAEVMPGNHGVPSGKWDFEAHTGDGRLRLREGEQLYLSIEAPGALKIQLDFARHRRVLNFDKDYARLNEFPEWYTVDENRIYRLRNATSGTERLFLGSELIAGITLAPGPWIVEMRSAATPK